MWGSGRSFLGRARARAPAVCEFIKGDTFKKTHTFSRKVAERFICCVATGSTCQRLLDGQEFPAGENKLHCLAPNYWKGAKLFCILPFFFFFLFWKLERQRRPALTAEMMTGRPNVSVIKHASVSRRLSQRLWQLELQLRVELSMLAS